MIKSSILDKSTLHPNFIGSWTIESFICDQIITYYEENKNSDNKYNIDLFDFNFDCILK